MKFDALTNEFYNPQEEFRWEAALIKEVEDGPPPTGPFTISGNGFTYTHIPDTESFYLTSPEYPITALKVMKAILPDTIRSLYQRIIPPDQFYYFGDSTRFKIIKAVQAHYQLPTSTTATDAFIPFFDHLSENVKDHWTVQQQYSAAKWATQHDKSAATSLLLHYGWSPRHEPRMLGSSMHKLRILEDGVFIDMSYTHTFQERVDAACAEALFTVNNLTTHGLPLTTEPIQSAALRVFYYFKDKYISLQNTYSMSIKSKIYNYIEALINPLSQVAPSVPDVDEPEDILPDESIFLKWEDFKFDSPYSLTSAAAKQRLNNARNTSFEAFQEKTKHFPRGVPIPRQTFLEVTEGRQFSAWTNLGFVIQTHKEGRSAFYKISDEGEEE